VIERESLIEARHLTKTFGSHSAFWPLLRRWQLPAVDDVSFDIVRGETLGLVGESGCGKSTTGRLITRMIEPTAGEIRFDKIDLRRLSAKELRRVRRRFQIVFQDPVSSLNPRMTLEALVGEPLRLAGKSRQDTRDRVREILPLVGLRKEYLGRRAHQFSGGQRQRIGIARALALQPEFVFCDEPVSALDVSVQAQVINLLIELQDRLGLTYLFVSHDLRVVRHIADRVAVMYLGRIVELARKKDIFKSPAHPYTRMLMSAVPHPRLSADRKEDFGIAEAEGDIDHSRGCRFRNRCRLAQRICFEEVPKLKEIGRGHKAACHLASA
jgi:oligopeptide transport system ATP-binding protein